MDVKQDVNLIGQNKKKCKAEITLNQPK